MLKRFVADVRKFFHYAVYSAKAELKAEVASSYLNWVWWVLEPFCFMLIYSLVFGVVFNSREKYFPAFIFLGLTAWEFFNKDLQNSVKMVRNNKAIVAKVYVPKFVLILSKMMVNGFKMFINMLIVVGMMIFFRVHVSWKVLYFIPIVITLFVLTFGCMTILLNLGVYIEDMSNVVSIVLRLLFYMTGIFYNIETRLKGRVPDMYVRLVENGNPMALILSSLRKCMLYDTTPNWRILLFWLGFGLILSVIGVRIIYKNENSYVKVI